MSNNDERIKKLSENLETLAKRQESFGKAIRMLREEIYLLKNTEEVPAEVVNEIDESQLVTNIPLQQDKTSTEYKVPRIQKTKSLAKKPSPLPGIKSNLEKFIGENLISKIGILIIILGVGIGAKYAIDNDLVSPLTRIILGYLVGLGLIGFALKLKKNYKNFSSVLLSGAMAILYFITFAAYSFYGLFPQGFAFGLMALFTVFTVIAAINYDKQIIALIGLVGAYAVPFLLSSGSGQIAVLFSYMAIINIGILAIAVKKYWKILYASAFLITWLIFISWWGLDYTAKEHFSLASIFVFIFFIIFYITFLANKLINENKFGLSDIILLLFNSFIFYGIGFALLDQHETGKHLLGLFTLSNAVLHFIVSYIVYQKKLADRNLQYIVSGLVLVFVTLAIPIQLDGNWVTLLWASEAALLFWIGKSKNVSIYETLSYPLMILAFGSLLHDWAIGYNQYYIAGEQAAITPIFNIHFLTSMIFIAFFAFMYWINQSKQQVEQQQNSKTIVRLFSFLIPSILLFTIYYAFRIEIENYWHELYIQSEIYHTIEEGQYSSFTSNLDLRQYQDIWIINYTLFFLTLLSFANFKYFKNRNLGIINLIFNLIGIGAFLTMGLYAFSELRESYLSQSLAEYYDIGWFNIGIRYVSIVFAAVLLIASFLYTRQDFMKGRFKVYFELFLQVCILWVASSELIHWLDMAGSPENYKLGLSILWGVYSLILIALGIWKKKKHWRLGAIVLFGITLLKLFLYDISHLDTISKTIVFVSLGVLLLIISFLYNKYKDAIFDEE